MAFRIFAFLFLFLSSLEGAYSYSSYGEEEKFYSKRNKETCAEGGVEALISFHQRVISEADGPRSSFYPSSSQYMLTAVRRFGLKGFFMGMDRLLRENHEAWLYKKYLTHGGHLLKYDPVPYP